MHHNNLLCTFAKQSKLKLKKMKNQKEMFDYLNDLRDSGAINMFGAVPYLREEFDLDKKEAREVLKAWMENFKSE